ncbi:MAG: transglycosylase domain-containing protein, partial [Flavobacteriales bacterium]|nr:transglycosylase domain-containing protein [Flavobacteriales bacterium]
MAKKPSTKKPKAAKSGGWFKRILRFVGKTILGLFLFSILMVIVYRFVPVPITILQLTRCVEQVQEGKPLKLKKDWESLENISNKLQLAVVCAEDQKFLNHYGFDVEA